jgi:hypothetical protein
MRYLIIFVLLLLSGCGTPQVLVTSPLTIETANSAKYGLYCNVLNVSSSPRTGTLQIVMGDGTPISSAGYNAVPPGVLTGIQVQKFQNVAAVTLVYCRITVNANRDSIRANLVLTDAKGNALVNVDAH